MRFFSIVLCASFFTLLSLAVLTPLHAQESLQEKITSIAQPYVDAEIVIGISIGVIRNEDTVQVHLGKIRKGGEAPNEDTIYEIGSTSKVFTGVLLADAVNQGQLRLDQPAHELLPKGVAMPKGKREITLLDLATHRSGLPRLPGNLSSTIKNPLDPYANYTSKDAYEFLSDHELAIEPGVKRVYSNFGTCLLGKLICNHAGKSYDEILAERITTPLGMKDTSVKLKGTMKSRMATPYNVTGEESHTWDFRDLPGSGGIRSSTSDMLRFIDACVNVPDSDVGKALSLAAKEHVPSGKGGLKGGLNWSFGPDGVSRWHNGETGGYHAMMMYDPSKKVGIVVLANTATDEVDKLAIDLFRTVRDGEEKPSVSAKQPNFTEKMDRLVGKYELTPTFVFTVTRVGNRLMVGITGQQTQEVFRRTDTQWEYKGIDASLEFNLDKKGKATTLVLVQDGTRQTANRIVNVDSKTLDGLVGKYQLARDFVFTVTKKGDRLMVGITNQETQEVFPRSKTEWYYKDVDASLEFKVNRKGKASSLVLVQNGARRRARRVK